MEREIVVVAIFVSPGVAAGGGGFVILPGGHVKPVPPRSPLIADLEASANVLASATKIKDKAVSKEIQAMAGKVISATAKKVVGSMG